VSPPLRRDYGVRMRTVLTEPFRLRTWRETAWALLALWIGVFWFCVLVTLLATGIGLAITIVGLPILALTLVLATWGARLERSLARGLLRVHVDEPPTEVDEGKESWRRVLQLLTSERRWRSVLYLLLLLPVGLLEFVVAVTLWAIALGYLSAPFWWWAVSDADFLWDGNRLDTPWEWALVVAGGFAALLAAPWLVRGCVWLHVALMRGLVGPTRRELERAAAQAGTERDQAVATASRDRRAIERDLHDGAQARLVALAVDLDRARHRLEDGGSEEEALALVRSAQEQAQTALSEIRDLARGVHPAILTNRGLDAALSALAARSAVPVALTADVPERAPGDVEAAAYFVASEALANANRHADATQIRLAARVDRDRLVLEIADDGLGGADEALGTGIAGLRERVGALGGTLDITSVAGAGTTIVARLPCAS
jgi:signal transduction histidine kinase